VTLFACGLIANFTGWESVLWARLAMIFLPVVPLVLFEFGVSPWGERICLEKFVSDEKNSEARKIVDTVHASLAYLAYSSGKLVEPSEDSVIMEVESRLQIADRSLSAYIARRAVTYVSNGAWA